MQSIHINLDRRSYDIQIGAGNLPEVGQFLTERAKVTHVVLITDENVHKLYAMQVAESFGLLDIETDVIVVAPGEESKSLDVAAGLWQGLLDLGADRKTVVAAVGGGVIGDLAGFIAATYARGLRFLQVPTSLLAQVDSSVGGKVGIDLPEAKNMLGAFHQPLGVLIDTTTLATLSDREYRAGLAEVVKYGVILDAEFFEFLETHTEAVNRRDPDVLVRIIARCCRLKADVVEQDEREETGLRAVLNFGHTFGHAFEMLSWQTRGQGRGARDEGEKQVASGQWLVASEESQISNPKSQISSPQSPIPNPPLLHGEAVAIGMVCAARLAERLGRTDAKLTDRLRALLATFGLPTAVPKLDPQKIIDAMTHDKKVQHGKLSFVLPSRLGQVELVLDIAPADIRAALKDK